MWPCQPRGIGAPPAAPGMAPPPPGAGAPPAAVRPEPFPRPPHTCNFPMRGALCCACPRSEPRASIAARTAQPHCWRLTPLGQAARAHAHRSALPSNRPSLGAQATPSVAPPMGGPPPGGMGMGMAGMPLTQRASPAPAMAYKLNQAAPLTRSAHHAAHPQIVVPVSGVNMHSRATAASIASNGAARAGQSADATARVGVRGREWGHARHVLGLGVGGE